MQSIPVFKQVPFLRLLLPLILGILFGLSEWNIFNLSFWFIILFASLGFFIFSIIISSRWKYRWASGVGVSLFLLVAGVAVVTALPGSSKIETTSEIDCLVRLLEPAERRTTSVRATAEIESIIEKGVAKPIGEKVIIYFSATDTNAFNLGYGAIIALKAKFSEIPKPQNPGEFDYRAYLTKKGIFRTSFVESQRWTLVGQESNPIFELAFNLRKKLLTLVSESGVKGQNLAVISALTMGYKGLLDEETQRNFSASGAMHILAVSGLHVGILFIVFSSLLFMFDRLRRGRLIKAVILIAFLWAFAIFTGMSPSVLRASLMFSLVIVGKALSRSSSIYNTLAASAFILLAANPMLATEVGFQLSYLAVTAIVFFYPHIYSWIYVPNKYLDKVWSLIAVSLAAQLGTFPLGLYFFNQFPNYFLLTNLFAIPLATIILYLTLALALVSPFPVLAMGFGWLLNNLVSLLNFLTSWVESLPFSTVSSIYIGVTQTILLFCSIIFFAVFLERRKPLVIMLMLGSIIVFLGVTNYQNSNRVRVSEMVVFSNRRTPTIGLFANSRLLVLTGESDTLNMVKSAMKPISGYIGTLGTLTDEKVITIQNWGEPYFELKEGYSLQKNPLGYHISLGHKLVFIPIGKLKVESESPLIVDVLVLTSLNRMDIDDLLTIINPRKVVIDATVNQWRAEIIMKALVLKGIEVHYVRNQGAFTLRT
jgi:competence protein ComEC